MRCLLLLIFFGIKISFSQDTNKAIVHDYVYESGLLTKSELIDSISARIKASDSHYIDVQFNESLGEINIKADDYQEIIYLGFIASIIVGKNKTGMEVLLTGKDMVMVKDDSRSIVSGKYSLREKSIDDANKVGAMILTLSEKYYKYPDKLLFIPF